MAVDYPDLLDQLRIESDGLLAVLATLDDEQWRTATPAAGWTVTDQVSHLAFFDDAAVDALHRPDDFATAAAELIRGGMDFPDRIAARFHDTAPDELLAWFTRSRRDLLDAFAAVEPGHRVPWYGPDMSAASSVTARLMETWAHGQDVYDAVGVDHPPSRALRSIAHLGVSTFGFTHRNNGLAVPDTPVRVVLTAPDGDLWTWGPDDAADSVTGPAEDFVFVVTQRRHIADTALDATGEVAQRWMTIAQAFAGSPGPGRAPSTRRHTTSVQNNAGASS